MNYYEKQLQPIIDQTQTNPGEIFTLKIRNSNYETKWLSLNLESAESLKAFSDILFEVLSDLESKK